MNKWKTFVAMFALLCPACTSTVDGTRLQRDATGNAIWSFIIPGSGQFMNGDTGRGLLMMGINVGCGIAIMDADSDEDTTGYLVVSVANEIWSTADAYVRANELNRTSPLGMLPLSTDAYADQRDPSTPLTLVLDPFSQSVSAELCLKF